MTPKNYPFEPFWIMVGRPSFEEFGRRFEVTSRTVRRWSNYGIPAAQADRVAIVAGYHPGIVWADWWLAA